MLEVHEWCMILSLLHLEAVHYRTHPSPFTLLLLLIPCHPSSPLTAYSLSPFHPSTFNGTKTVVCDSSHSPTLTPYPLLIHPTRWENPLFSHPPSHPLSPTPCPSPPVCPRMQPQGAATEAQRPDYHTHAPARISAQHCVIRARTPAPCGQHSAAKSQSHQAAQQDFL